MEKSYFFLSGLPRSGSTLLAAILSQNPEIYVSITSPLLQFLGQLEMQWIEAYKSFTCPFTNHLQNMSKGLLHGFYQEVERKYIIDKSRGWPANIKKLQSLLGKPPKIICTVRDLPSVVSSFYRVIDWEPSGKSPIDQGLVNDGLALNKNNRVERVWHAMVRGSWMSFKAGYQEFPDCIHLVEYEDLLSRPDETLQKIYQFLDLETFVHNFENISQPIVEDDSKWGIRNLHTIGRKLERQNARAEELLGEEIFNTFDSLRLEFWRSV